MICPSCKNQITTIIRKRGKIIYRYFRHDRRGRNCNHNLKPDYKLDDIKEELEEPKPEVTVADYKKAWNMPIDIMKILPKVRR